MTTPEIARRIDHTLLKPEATLGQIDRLIDEAIAHHFATVCINPLFVPHARARLNGSDVAACTVVGFPLGATFASIKAGEAAAAVMRGAAEIDVVAHLPHLLAADAAAARAEIEEVVYTVRELRPSVVVKVIVESALLMKDAADDVAERRIAAACEAVRDAGADFIKTSTGFHPAGGATLRAVELMKKHAGSLKIKAAGGIRNLDDACRYLQAGADRLGTSSGVEILRGATASGAY